MADNLLQNTDTTTTVPGWYRDPTSESDQRFWDGTHWTLLTRDDIAVVDELIIEEDPPEKVLDELPAGHPDASPAPQGRRRTDADDDANAPTSNDSFFEVSSGPERRVVRLEPTEGRLPKRRSEEASATSLFGDRRSSESPAFVPTVAKPTRVAKIAGPMSADQTKKRIRRPEGAPLTKTESTGSGRRRLLLLALTLGAGGLTIGYLSGSSDNELVAIEANKSLTESVNSSVAASGRPGQVIVLERELQRAGQDLKTTNDELEDVADEVIELEGELSETEVELEVVTAERDDLSDHNDVLQTWFTDDLRGKGQIAWDKEVVRACDLVNNGAILSTALLQYSRSMELIGTEAALYRAVAACAAG